MGAIADRFWLLLVSFPLIGHRYLFFISSLIPQMDRAGFGNQQKTL